MEMEMPNCGDGLSIMVIDHDTTSLMSLATMLEHYSYKVTTTERASVAISMIQQEERRFKLVMADLNLNDTSNLSFLLMLHKLNIPFILMSKEGDQEVGEKAIEFGASLYLVKPIAMNELEHIGQHAYRTRQPRFDAARRDTLLDDHGLDWKINSVDPRENSAIERNQNKSSKSPSPRPKPPSPKPRKRLVWNEQLHRKFVAVLKVLGDEKARPKSILRMMKEPNLTHRQVASHLQKHKAELKRVAEASANNVAFDYSKPSYFYMQQQNIMNQPWHQNRNLTPGFAPNNSMNQPWYQNPNYVPGSTSSGYFVNPNPVSEPWTQTIPGSLDTSVTTEINVGNQEMDSAEILLDNLNQQSPGLAQLLKDLDDDEAAAIEPNPAEVDQLCEWLKEAMQGNDDNNPGGGLGF